MKNIRRNTLALFTLIFAIYVLIFIYFVHEKRETFKQNKAEILISAGYSVADVDSVVLWRQNGHYYVNGQHNCGNHQITTGIDNLIKTNESYNILEALMILVGILLIILLRVTYEHIAKYGQDEFASSFLLEQEAIQKARASLKIYDCVADKAHNLSSESSEEIESDEPNSEDSESDEPNSED